MIAWIIVAVLVLVIVAMLVWFVHFANNLWRW